MGWISNSYFDRIYQHESVLDLVLSGLSGTLGLEDGCVTDAHIRKLKRLLLQVGLEDKMDSPYNWLSKGERKNILILRALLGKQAEDDGVCAGDCAKTAAYNVICNPSF